MKSYMTTSIDRSPQNEYPLLKKQLLKAALSIGLITVLIAPLVGCDKQYNECRLVGNSKNCGDQQKARNRKN